MRRGVIHSLMATYNIHTDELIHALMCTIKVTVLTCVNVIKKLITRRL